MILEDMKCAACGYHFYREYIDVDKAVYYKSGKNKGELKEVKSEEKKIEFGDEEFGRLSFSDLIDDKVRVKVNLMNIEASLYVCPKCGTVRTDYAKY